MIDQSTIDRIYDAAQIVEVVQDFVSLKRRGANYIGCCPFHNEKTPSFTVSAAKGIYKCFGCGKGGNVVNFIMEHENLGYFEALKYLGKKYHIEIVEKEATPEDAALKNERESMLLVSDFAAKFFHNNLSANPEGQAIGMGYFRERGIHDTMITKFTLGYSPEKRDALAEAAIKAGYKTEYLTKTGLVIEKENYRFDRFAGRVIFPIHSISGQVIGFGGRILKTDKQTAKYLNSPESEIYHKSKVLYGMFQAKKAIHQLNKCYLVEGYTDVISLHQVGIENVVASSGTSLTEEQIKLIKRFTNNLTILYDGDAAGIKAALRGIDMALEQDLNVKVLLLPDGEDPDSFAQKHGASEVLSFIEKNESDFVIFKTKLLYTDTQNDPVKRAALITDIVSSIAAMPEAIKRSVYTKECATLLNVDEQVLISEVAKIRRNKYNEKAGLPANAGSIEPPKPPAPARQAKISETGIEIVACEREIIRALVKYGNYILYNEYHEDQQTMLVVTVAHFIITEIEKDELKLEHPVYRQIFDEFARQFHDSLVIDEKYFINHPDNQINSVIADMLAVKYLLSEKLFTRGSSAVIETEKDKLAELVPGIILSFKTKKVLELQAQCYQQITEADKNGETEKIAELLKVIQNLNEVKKTLAQNLGGRIIVH